MKGKRLFFSNLDAYFGIFMLSAMVLIMFSQVVARYLFRFPLIWPEELVVLFMIWMVFIGAVAVSRSGGHIKVDIISELLPEKWQRWMTIVFELVTAVMLGLISFSSLEIVLKTWQVTTPTLGLPRGLAYLGTLIGTFSLTIYYIYHVITLALRR